MWERAPVEALGERMEHLTSELLPMTHMTSQRPHPSTRVRRGPLKTVEEVAETAEMMASRFHFYDLNHQGHLYLAMMPPWQMIPGRGMDMIPTIEHNNEFTPSAPFTSQVYEKYALIEAALGGHLWCVSVVGASWIAVVNMFLGSTAKGFFGSTWKSSLSSNAHLVVRYLVMNDLPSTLRRICTLSMDIVGFSPFCFFLLCVTWYLSR